MSGPQEANETQIKWGLRIPYSYTTTYQENGETSDVSGLSVVRTLPYGIDRLLFHRIVAILQWCTEQNQNSTSMSSSVIVIALPDPQ